ncbi:Glutamate racemase 1 [subsurface metagenome]
MILKRHKPIAIFDSGIGGLSVLIEIKKILPDEKIIYLADKKRHPFGTRSKDEIEKIVYEIINFLISKNVKMIVIACNTASTIKLDDLRKEYEIPVIGMIEPEVVSQYINKFRGNSVGLIGTTATINSKAYDDVIKKLNTDIKLYSKDCSKLVPLIETGKIESDSFKEELNNCLSLLLSDGITNLIIGCTHFSFIIERINDLLGNNVNVFNPSRFVAHYVKEKLSHEGLLNSFREIYEPEYLITSKRDEFINTGHKMTSLAFKNLKLITI